MKYMWANNCNLHKQFQIELRHLQWNTQTKETPEHSAEEKKNWACTTQKNSQFVAFMKQNQIFVLWRNPKKQLRLIYTFSYITGMTSLLVHLPDAGSSSYSKDIYVSCKRYITLKNFIFFSYSYIRLPYFLHSRILLICFSRLKAICV